jgi:hypothetical protein
VLIANGNKSRYLIYERGGHSEILFEALADPRMRLVNDLVSFVKVCGRSDLSGGRFGLPNSQ